MHLSHLGFLLTAFPLLLVAGGGEMQDGTCVCEKDQGSRQVLMERVGRAQQDLMGNIIRHIIPAMFNDLHAGTGGW